MAYTVLNARVKQKIATEAYWLSIETELGPIFEGEQAFVFNDAGDPVNFKIGDGTRLFSELPYFIAYYTGVTAQKILKYLLQTANVTIPSVFKNLTLLQDIVFLNTSGSPITMNIGTTNGGSEIATVTLAVGQTTIGLKKEFASAQTLYFTGLTGTTFSMYILYYQLDEAPAIPPTSTTGSGGGYNYGTIYPFYPMYVGHENVAFNLTTGIGNTGTPYEGCILMGTNGTDSFEDVYLKGLKVGETIGGDTGNATSQVTLVEANIPKHSHKLFSGAGPAGQLSPDVGGLKSVAWSSNHTAGNQDYDMKNATDDNPSMGHTSTFGQTSPNPIDLKPKSKIVLYFTGPVTT
jgi:hypothetical protein